MGSPVLKWWVRRAGQRAFAAAMVALLAPSHSSAAWAQGTLRPTWIEVLPDRPGRLYAMGLAPLTGAEGEAIKQASQNARVEVVSRLRSSVKSESLLSDSASSRRQLGGPTTAEARQSLEQSSKISTQVMDLPGLSIAETWVDAKGRTVYALAYLDVTSSQMDMQLRLDDIRKLMGEGEDGSTPKERARSIQSLKKGRTELLKLERWADLLAAGGGLAMVRSDIRNTQSGLERRLDQLKRSLMLGHGKESGLTADIATLLQNAAQAQGLGWGGTRLDFTAQIRLLTGGQGDLWWEVDASPDFTTARGALQLTLVDRAGLRYEAAPIEAVGIGTSRISAHQALLKDCQKKLEAALDEWLNDLAL